MIYELVTRLLPRMVRDLFTETWDLFLFLSLLSSWHHHWHTGSMNILISYGRIEVIYDYLIEIVLDHLLGKHLSFFFPCVFEKDIRWFTSLVRQKHIEYFDQLIVL